MKNTKTLLMAIALMTTASVAAEASGSCYIIATESVTNNPILTRNAETIKNCSSKVVVQPKQGDYSATLMQAKSSGASVVYLAVDPTTSSQIISSAENVGFPTSKIVSLH